MEKITETKSKKTKPNVLLQLKNLFDFETERRCRREIEKNKDCIEILWYIRKI